MKSAIAWFARNGIAPNLFMVVILVVGFLTALDMKREVFPEMSTDHIRISVVYRGASPEEVEEAVNVRIEERIQDLEGIKKITSIASEGAGTVLVEVIEGANSRDLLSDIKTRVDAIDSFPVETEKPIVQELLFKRQVITVAVSGDAPERTLKHLAERVRDDISAIDGITQVELAAVRPYEISIAVSEADLQRHGLTFDFVANAVRRSSVDLPAGSIDTAAGEVLIRTDAQASRRMEFEDLQLLTRPDGTRLTLGDVATIDDGFAETDNFARFDGNPAALVLVFRVGEQDATYVANRVKEYVLKAKTRLPDGIELTTWQDDTLILESRLSLLMRNGRAGLILVLVVLALFLKLRLAGWVALGIPISFLGAIWVIPLFDISVNLLSLFAFLVVLGIVVDDAIVVGENIYRHHQEGKEGLAAAIDGAQEVAVPVAFSVLTTIAAFSPLLMVGGNIGKFMRVIPIIAITTLVFSLLESLFVLPTHLSHLRHREKAITSGFSAGWTRFRERLSSALERFVERVYAPLLEQAIEWRYLTVAFALAMLFLTLGYVGAGWLKFTFMPPVEADNVVALLEMPQGTPPAVTARAVREIEASAIQLKKEIEEEQGQPVFRHILTSIGEQPYRTAQSQGGGSLGTLYAGQNLGEVNIELASSELRNIGSAEIERRWRERTPFITDAVELSYTSSLFSTGEPINVQLTGNDIDELRRAADRLKAEVAKYPGVFDIADSFRVGKEELKVDITEEGESAGLTRADLARQVRQAFYGEEAQRIQRGRDDVRVMVRYPEDERRSLEDIDEMRIRTPQGVGVPFSVAGRADRGRGYASITRVDRRRAINVTADVDPSQGNENEILAALEETALPGILADHPGVRYSFEGQQKEQRETVGGLRKGFVAALLLIYALLAIPFRSYVQPVIVMCAIPFGIVGAIWGHVVMGLNLTVLSFFGIVALTGVVVNDSLVMVDFINRRFRGGASLDDALKQAGIVRFRPILLTSLTTFVCLLPLLLEKSLQAQFLIPMAVSLAFGVIFATAVTLVLVPVLFRILEDVRASILGSMSRPLDEAREA